MDEILFHGKRIDDQRKWIEGSIVIGTSQINNGKYYILNGISDFSYGDNGNRCRIGCFIEVDPATVGQYIGRKDKNGIRIFSNSRCVWFSREVVEYIGGYPRLEPVGYLGTIHYEQPECAYFIEFDDGESLPMSEIGSDEVEVIDN